MLRSECRLNIFVHIYERHIERSVLYSSCYTYIRTSHRIASKRIELLTAPIPLQTFVSFICTFRVFATATTTTTTAAATATTHRVNRSLFCVYVCFFIYIFFLLFFGDFIEIFIQFVLFINDKWTGILK